MKKQLLSFALLFASVSLFAQGGSSCDLATPITANGNFQTGTISGTYPTPSTACFQQAAANANWFVYTPTQDGVITINADIAANPANTDTRLSIFTGTCLSLTCVAANDDVNEAANNFRSKIENFAVTSGTTYYISWDNRWGASSAGFFDFTFTAQTCFKPTNFGFTQAPTTTSVSIGWSAPATGTTPVGYQVEYGVRGFTQGTGTILNPTTTSVDLTPLTPGTVYEFYIRTNCGSGDYSVWEGPIAFNTVFEPANVPYTTSFEDTAFEFIGWTAPQATQGGWQLFSNASLANDGDVSLVGVSSNNAIADAYVISRGVNLTGGEQATISFFVKNYLQSGSTSTGSYELSWGNQQTAAAQTNSIGSESNITDAAYVQKTYTFTPSQTGVYYFALKNVSPQNTTGLHALFFDNFSVTQTSSNSEFVASKLIVYPNPAQDVVNVSNNANLTINKLTVTDINGRVVKQIAVDAVASSQVSVSDLSAGAYFLTVDTNEGTATKKFFKN